MATRDLSGQRFGRWSAMNRWRRNKAHHVEWLCRCTCGVVRWVRVWHLRCGNSQSCGCLSAELTAKRFTTHGHIKHGQESPEYRSWLAMIQRCTNSHNVGYADYGGRGITVCTRWRKFENFLADMGERPTGTSIDRIDNNGSYCPTNCRWATANEQRRNQRPPRRRKAA